jgi:hypothetical protein
MRQINGILDIIEKKEGFKGKNWGNLFCFHPLSIDKIEKRNLEEV